jgi:hypothetical protein
MEGNAWENSSVVRREVRGDEDDDRGLSAKGDAKEWDALAELDIFDETGALWLMWSGPAVVVGNSRETRLVLLTDKPASCNDRIRSAMLPLDRFCTPFSGGGERCPLSLKGTCKLLEMVGGGVGIDLPCSNRFLDLS